MSAVFNPCSPGKNEKKKTIFESSVILKTLNINNWRMTIATSIKLDTIRKLIKYSLETVPVNAMFTLNVYEKW